MFRRLSLLFVAVSSALLFAEPSEKVFELRTYHANEGKLDALHARFRDHTVSLFEKHGMTNVAYWTPVKNEKNLLIYLLSYPSKEAREKSWQGFMSDPDWQAAFKASTAEGRLVGKIDSVFLKETDFSAAFTPSESTRLFEMRTYTTAEGMLPHLHKRFRDHTMKLFQKHGMSNLAYFELLADQDKAEQTLLYFLAHKDAEAAKKSWDGFRAVPEWKKVAAKSEEDAGGRILVKGGVEAVYLQPTDYSPIK
ncbi:NIPSNAP family protein [Roseibacillus persicicus]|uniref:NIPSNAP family protein n=1 Tax=Roseibacillus persicicus TaxID=454148 RepID=UPI00398AB419